MKTTYVRTMRGLRAALRAVGLLTLLDAWARRSRAGAWLRSLLAIYDVRDIVALDTPWWTFRSADAVADHLRRHPGARVFEWGSGASTAWLAARAGSVVAVEHDPGWAEQVQALVGPRATVVVTPPERTNGSGPGVVRSSKPGFDGLDFASYVRAIDEHPGTFDLVVIDGRAREACLPRALARLAPDGLVVFDNVDRRRYRDAISRHAGIEVWTTRGLTPALPYPTRTALIRKSSGS